MANVIPNVEFRFSPILVARLGKLNDEPVNIHLRLPLSALSTSFLSCFTSIFVLSSDEFLFNSVFFRSG